MNLKWRDIGELHKGGQQPEARLTFITTSGTSDIQYRGSCNQVLHWPPGGEPRQRHQPVPPQLRTQTAPSRPQVSPTQGAFEYGLYAPAQLPSQPKAGPSHRTAGPSRSEVTGPGRAHSDPPSPGSSKSSISGSVRRRSEQEAQHTSLEGETKTRMSPGEESVTERGSATRIKDLLN
jgi:hypothetical protein